jgi:hypothetical protein
VQYKYTVQTDQTHKIKVDSNLIYALWRTGFARGGGATEFEVRTSFVGDGASIEVTVKGDDYGKINKIKDKIYGNHYNGSVDIPAKIKPGESIWFEVKLPKHGLKGESNTIPAAPLIELRRMQWSKKEARRGDVLKLTAELEGVEEGAEATVVIYEYDRDGNHDKIATIPTEVKSRKVELDWEYQYHEDTDEIPTDEEMKKYGKKYNPPEHFFVVVIDGQRVGGEQESGLLGFKDSVQIELKDDIGNPVSDAKYVLELPDGTQKSGNLDKDGKATEEGIVPGEVKVCFPDHGLVSQSRGTGKRAASKEGEMSVPSGKKGHFKRDSFRFSR